MNKPRGFLWLEEAIGETLDIPAHVTPEGGKHLSIRVATELANRLEEAAAEHGFTVSQFARKLLSDGLDRLEHPDQVALDEAIAVLQRAKRGTGPRD